MPGWKTTCTLTAMAALLLVSHVAGAAVIVFDTVSLTNRPVQLSVLTKGRLFPKGGQLVALYVGPTRLKRVLTGGDGYGYFMYTPPEAGLQTVGAVYEGKRESGRLLVMAPGEQAILIDVENALRESIFATGLRHGSREALEVLNKNFRIIYLHGLTGLALTRQWLKANELPPSVVLPWRNAAAMKALERKGIAQHALIGSAAQMRSARENIQNRFSFEKTEDGRQIDSWPDVLRALGLENPMDTD